MAQLGASSHNRKVAGSIPSQGTCLGCGFVPPSVHGMGAYRRPPIDASLSHPCFLSLPSSLFRSSRKKTVLLCWVCKKLAPSPQDQVFQSRKSNIIALAGVVQWTEHWPANQRVEGSIPSQDTCLGYRPRPQ